MAQLKDLVVTGPSRFIGEVYGLPEHRLHLVPESNIEIDSDYRIDTTLLFSDCSVGDIVISYREQTVNGTSSLILKTWRVESVDTYAHLGGGEVYGDTVFSVQAGGMYVTASASSKHYLLGMTATAGTMTTGNTHTGGNGTAGVYWQSSELYATSDERKKDFISDIKVDFDELKKVPKKYFRWKEGDDTGKVSIGTSAQKLMEVYPEVVSYDESDDSYGVSYEKLSVIALAAIDKLHEENEGLKSEIEELKRRLDKIS